MTKTNLYDSSGSEDEESFILPQQKSTNSTSTSKTNFDFDCAHETPIRDLPEDLDLEILLQGDEIDSESTKKKLRTIIFESELIPEEIRSNAHRGEIENKGHFSRWSLARFFGCNFNFWL